MHFFDVVAGVVAVVILQRLFKNINHMKQEPTTTRPAERDDNPPATMKLADPAPEVEPSMPIDDDAGNIDDELPPQFPVYARRSIWDC